MLNVFPGRLSAHPRVAAHQSLLNSAGSFLSHCDESELQVEAPPAGSLNLEAQSRARARVVEKLRVVEGFFQNVLQPLAVRASEDGIRHPKAGEIVHIDCGHNGALSSFDARQLEEILGNLGLHQNVANLTNVL